MRGSEESTPSNVPTGSTQDLFPLIYEELRHLAERFLETERPDHTLQPTALVHEVYLRLKDRGEARERWVNRAHFLHAAARAMRRVLVDSARARRAGKRGGDRAKLPIEHALDLFEDTAVDLVALDEGLSRLAEMDEQLGRIVELRFFAGSTLEDTARAMGISTPTVGRGWRGARLWLQAEFAPSNHRDEPPETNPEGL